MVRPLQVFETTRYRAVDIQAMFVCEKSIVSPKGGNASRCCCCCICSIRIVVAALLLLLLFHDNGHTIFRRMNRRAMDGIHPQVVPLPRQGIAPHQNVERQRANGGPSLEEPRQMARQGQPLEPHGVPGKSVGHADKVGSDLAGVKRIHSVSLGDIHRIGYPFDHNTAAAAVINRSRSRRGWKIVLDGLIQR